VKRLKKSFLSKRIERKNKCKTQVSKEILAKSKHGINAEYLPTRKRGKKEEIIREMAQNSRTKAHHVKKKKE